MKPLNKLACAALIAIGLAPLSSAALWAADKVDVAAAKAEGSVVWYTSTPIDQANKLVKLFQDKYGIKVEMFRSGGSEILRRFMQEQQAKRIAADVLTTSDPEAVSDLARRGTFVAFNPEGSDQIPAMLKDPDHHYFAQRLNIVGFYAKTDLVPPADQPKTWADLTKPQYKGKLVITDPSFTVLQLYVVGMISKDLGWDYYKKLNDNGVMIVKGGQQTFDAVLRGERPISGGTDISYAQAARMTGAPVAPIFPDDGAFVIPAPTAVVKGSPHPNAAKLLAEFMISKDAQNIFPQSGNYAARTDVAAPTNSPALAEMKMRTIDYAYIKKSGAEIKKRFNEIFQ